MDLTTTWMGLELDGPMIVGASPLSDDVHMVQRLEEAGASAVVMHSLFMEQITREQLAAHNYVDSHLDVNAEALSYLPEPEAFALGPDQYLEQVSRLKKAVSMPVIGSLNGIATGPWTRYARLIAEAGADGLELNVYYLPLDGAESPEQVEKRSLDILASVRAEIDVPIAMKLTWFHSSPVHLARRLTAAGANGLVLFNQVFHADIDIEALELVSTLHLSSPAELRVRLLWLAAMYGKVDTTLAVSGGVHDTAGVIKSIMAGADAVQITSALLEHGPLHMRRLRRELDAWMEEHEYASVSQMRGSMSLLHCPDPEAFERANYMRTLQSWRPPEEPEPDVREGFWGPVGPVTRRPRMGYAAPEQEHDHKATSRLLDRLEAARTATEVRSLLAELATFLPAHFAEEEAVDGVFDWVCAMAPALGEAVEELVADHAQLLGDLQRASDAGLRDEVTLERASRFAQNLRHHERREGRLVHDALGEPSPARPFPAR